jgi:ribosomal protein L24
MLDVKVPVAGTLKPGEKVAIIGGTYRGRDGSFVRSTPKMHYVKLSSDEVVRVYHGNVERCSLVAAHSEQEVKEVVAPVTVGDKDFWSSVKQLTLVEAVNLMLDIKVEALKEGDEVIIIGGTHRGREGMLVGSTPKMYYVRVGRAQEVRVQKGNVTSYALLEKLVKALVLK